MQHSLANNGTSDSRGCHVMNLSGYRCFCNIDCMVGVSQDLVRFRGVGLWRFQF